MQGESILHPTCTVVSPVRDFVDGEAFLVVEFADGLCLFDRIQADPLKVFAQGRYLMYIGGRDNPGWDFLPSKTAARQQTATTRYEAVGPVVTFDYDYGLQQALTANRLCELFERHGIESSSEGKAVEVYGVNVYVLLHASLSSRCSDAPGIVR